MSDRYSRTQRRRVFSVSQTVCLMWAVLLLGTCATVHSVDGNNAQSAQPDIQYSPRGLQCCPIPTSMEEIVAMTPNTTGALLGAAHCTHFCPILNSTIERSMAPNTIRPERPPLPFPDARRLCFRGSEKSGTSVALLFLHELTEKLGQVNNMTIIKVGQDSAAAWGFHAQVFPHNNSLVIFRAHTGPSYKHSASIPYQDCRMVLAVRDPRDMVISYFHHKAGRDTPFPADTLSQGQFMSTGNNARLHNWAAFIEGATRFPAKFMTEAHNMAGLLVLPYAFLTRDMGNAGLQVGEFFGFDMYGAQSTEIQDAIHALQVKFDPNAANKKIVEEALTRKTEPKWMHQTHFNGGNVGKWKSVLSPKDLRLMNSHLCSSKALVGLLWGVEGCHTPCARLTSNSWKGGCMLKV